MTGMNADMGQWLIWGLAGLTGLLVLFGMASWLRKNRATRIADTAEKASVSVSSAARETATTESVATKELKQGTSGSIASTDRHHSAGIITDRNGKRSGWGFWPWALLSLLLMGALAWLVWTTWGMNGMSAIKWIFFSLLGLGGLFAIMGFFQMIRRHPLVDEKRGSPRGLGFMTMITGLVLAGASWFVWQPKISALGGLSDKISAYQKEIGTYKNQLAGYDSKVTRFKNETTRLSAENGRLTGIISDLKSKLANAQADNKTIGELTSKISMLGQKNDRLGEEIARLREENKKLKGNISVNQTEGGEITRLNGVIARLNKNNADLNTENNRMKTVINTYKNDNEVQSAKIASLEAETAKIPALRAEIEKLKNRPPEIRTVTKTVTVPAPAPAAPATVVRKRATPLALIHKYNQDETKLRLTSRDYNMVKSPKVELVDGKRGHYYNIFLKNPASGKGYKFASASYSKIDNQGQFKQSLDRVISDIRGALDGKRNYQIYVRGKASAGRYHGKLAKGFEYTDIKVLEDKGGIYGPEFVDRHYGPDISNDDLPNLRGAYLQDYVSRNYKVAKPIILDGKVSKSKDPSKQAVALILYVED